MKRLFILLFILFHLTCLSDAKKDSLQVLVNSGVDSTRIIGLIEMSKLLMFKNPDTGLSIGIEALALSIKINDQKRIGLSHLRLFGCHWLLSQIDSCVNDGLSAAAAFEKANRVGRTRRNRANHGRKLPGSPYQATTTDTHKRN